MLAADGKPFDVDLIMSPTKEDEIEAIQYIRPNGKRRQMTCKVGKELAEKTKEMVLTLEDLCNGMFSFTARFKDEDEEKECIGIAPNKPNTVIPAVEKCILRKWRERNV